MQSAVSAGLVLVLFTITECEKNQNNRGNLLLACVFVRTKKTSRNNEQSRIYCRSLGRGDNPLSGVPKVHLFGRP